MIRMIFIVFLLLFFGHLLLPDFYSVLSFCWSSSFVSPPALDDSTAAVLSLAAFEVSSVAAVLSPAAFEVSSVAAVLSPAVCELPLTVPESASPNVTEAVRFCDNPLMSPSITTVTVYVTDDLLLDDDTGLIAVTVPV